MKRTPMQKFYSRNKKLLIKKNNKILKDSSINIISDFMEPLWQIKII